jgi:hypothetical protein
MNGRVQLAVGIDAFVVVAFVAIGRRNHDESPGVIGLLETAAPFLIGLALGWAAARVWSDPGSVKTGAIVWVTTVVAGMLLRRFVFSEGTATSFIIVATVFIGTFLVGWRAVGQAMNARRS